MDAGELLEPSGIEPAPSTTASLGPTQGGLILFKLPTSVYSDRPLTLTIIPPTGKPGEDLARFLRPAARAVRIGFVADRDRPRAPPRGDIHPPAKYPTGDAGNDVGGQCCKPATSTCRTAGAAVAPPAP